MTLLLWKPNLRLVMSKLIMTVVYNARYGDFGKRKVVTEHSSKTDAAALKRRVYRWSEEDIVSVTTHLWHNPHGACPAGSFCGSGVKSCRA